MFKTLLCLAACAAAIAGPAAASVTYEYDGHINPTNSIDGFGVTYVGANAPLTFTFTLANALAANSNYMDVSALVLSWTASGGQLQSTISNNSPYNDLPQLELDTDALGNIANFHIHAIGTNPNITGPETFLDFNFLGLHGDVADTLLFYRADAHFNYGDVNCSGTCGRNSPFILVDAPEPPSWPLLLAGLSLAIAATKRHRGD